MSELQTSLPATLVSSGPSPNAGRNVLTRLRTCLVVSASTRQAQHFVDAAKRQRWATIVCGNADEAGRQAVQNRIHLALVDLQTATTDQERSFRRLVEQLAVQDGLLLTVCGKPHDSEQEIWSRQLGVWMYLPGISGGSDVDLVCSQARIITEKLAAESAPRTTQHNGAAPARR